LERSREATLSKVTQIKGTLGSLAGTHSAAATDVETARAILTERERSIPEQFRIRTALNAAITAAEETLRQLVTVLEQAKTRVAGAEAEAAAAESTWLARVEAADQAQQRAHEHQLAFVERLGGQGFADRKTYHAAKRSAKALAELEATISAYDRDTAVAADRLSNAAKAAEGLTNPNTNELANTAALSRRAHEDALQREAALGEQLSQYAAWCDEAEKLSTSIEQLQQRYEVMGEVARIANGDNSYRMSFRRFVLAALLDEVLANASHRLQVMSRGRYTLQRTLDQLDRRSAGGLELEVLDLFTGRARLAKTLSGGESFLASLALALGLADVVQARTGGIHLETMFVDEGFGSLDERTLDQAVQTLSELQQGGRLVGIISHVTELQRRIAARLEVNASPSGSTARFVIGSAP
jgi:exonuclease SbcC